MRLRSSAKQLTTVEVVTERLSLLLGRKVIDSQDFVTELGMDSLDVVELVSFLDEVYHLNEQWEDYFGPRLAQALVCGAIIQLDCRSMAEFIDVRRN